MKIEMKGREKDNKKSIILNTVKDLFKRRLVSGRDQVLRLPTAA